MTDRCEHHKIPLCGDDECPACAASNLFALPQRSFAYGRTLRDDWDYCEEWLRDVCCDSAASAHYLRMAREEPHRLVAEWRWDTGLIEERLTVAVRVCSDCGAYIGTQEWRGTDAHPGEPWCETHGLCDFCEAAR